VETRMLKDSAGFELEVFLFHPQSELHNHLIFYRSAIYNNKIVFLEELETSHMGRLLRVPKETFGGS
jgi:hypothetical protein